MRPDANTITHIHAPQPRRLLCCSITGREPEEPIVASDGYVYDRQYYASFRAKSNVSPMTGSVFPDNQTYPVTLSGYLAIKSRLSAKHYISPKQGAILICRDSGQKSDNVCLLVEKKNEEGHVVLTQYRFQHDITKSKSMISSGIIQETRYGAQEYVSFSAQNIFAFLQISRESADAHTFSCDTTHISALERLITQDKQDADSQKLQYAYRSGKGLLHAWSFFGGTRIHNSFTWARSLLKRAGILTTTEIGFQRSSFEWMLGATPNNSTPSLSTSTSHNPGVSHHG